MNIEWKKISFEDKDVIQKYLKEEQPRNCEFTFANIYLWSRQYPISYAIIKDMLVFRSSGEVLSVTYPIGDANDKEVLLSLVDYFKEQNKPFHMHLITEEKFNLLESFLPGQFQIEYNRDDADYIYESEKLSSLSGKKLHSKRNHINRFKADNNWRYETLTENNLEECFQMALIWRNENGCEEDKEKNAEICVTLNALRLFTELELIGGIIKVDEKVVAFAIGEAASDDTFVVHIEKAFADIQGAYPMINQQFVEHELSEYQYINREEDLGAEGLRKAKLSYYPVFLLEKGNVSEL